MVDRGFNEVDLRRMLEQASGLREDIVEGRWIVETRHDRNSWEVVVEPDFQAHVVVVVTAYQVD